MKHISSSSSFAPSAQSDLVSNPSRKPTRWSSARRTFSKSSFSGNRRVTQKTLIHFTRSFSVMISARLSVVEALNTAAAASRSRALKGLLQTVSRDIQRGSSLSESLDRHPGTFNAMYVDLIRVGETAGLLDRVLIRMADHLEKTAAVRRKIRAALAYPTVIVVIATVAVAFFLTMIVPTFAEMFVSFGAELPAPTRFVIGLSDTLGSYWLLIGLVVAGLFGSGVVFRHTSTGALLWDRFRLKIPGLGTLTMKSLTAQFCRTLGTLLDSGIPLVEALSMLSRATGNAVLNLEVESLTSKVRRGGSMHKILKRTRFFPPMVVQMIAVGEQTAELGRMMTYVGEHFEREIDTTLDALTSVIEPVLIVFIGLFIGGILMAMYLPMFDLINVVG